MNPEYICSLSDSRDGRLLGTAFLVQRDRRKAHVMTAGHVLKDPSGGILGATSIQVTFPGGRQYQCKEIVAHSLPTSGNGYLDYGILVFEADERERQVAQLRMCRVPQGESYASVGFRLDQGKVRMADYIGKVHGADGELSSSNWCYATKSEFVVEKGYSGSPLAMHHNGNTGSVFAIQSMRCDLKDPISDAYHHWNFATPISRVFASETGLGMLLASNPWRSFDFLRKLFPDHEGKNPDQPALFVTVPEQSTEYGSKVYTQFEQLYGNSFSDLEIMLLTCGKAMFSGDVSPLPEHYDKRFHSCGRAPATLADAIHFDDDLALLDETLSRLKLVIDFASGFPDQEMSELELDAPERMLLQLRQGDPATKLIADGLGVTVVHHDAAEHAGLALAFLEDFMLDLNVFQSNPVFSGVFRTAESRRRLFEEKLSFAAEVARRQEGEGSFQSEGAMTIARCARRKPAGGIDLDLYKELWEEFAQNWLFPVLVPSRAGGDLNGNGLGSPEVLVALVRNALHSPAVQGQIGDGQIIKAYEKYRVGTNGAPRYCFFAISCKRPAPADRFAVAQLFGRSKWRKNMLACFPLEDVGKVAHWVGCVRLFFIENAPQN